MAIFGKSLAGAGYVVLNVIRAMNITALLAVSAASSVMLVKMFNNKSFFFFDACENLIRVVISCFLILTETPLFKIYFMTNWPLFAPSSGFVMLGAAQILLGNSLLANLNKENASQENIGLAFWRLIIGSGITIFVMGFLNILASYVFRDTKMGLTARQVRSSGATASHKLEVESVSTPKPTNRRSRYRSFFLRNGQRDSLPSYHAKTYMSQVQSPVPPMPTMTPTQPQTNSQGHIRMPSPTEQHFNDMKCAQSPGAASSKYSIDSRGDNFVARPNLAHHPAMTSGYNC
ncbi:hypothetical protein H2198_009236 [Neophaeococcomyces mojaviensis]|uniref:Uncharacterized protein n=1 Tax=Neophaeococcomyces mojaviensis TaxID=3383035 RepID=A0ACC2ZV08_9EURO|nr:hypothetical protein H2198_009236 [Knufia sp. JES_112]